MPGHQDEIIVRPIGIIHTPYVEKYHAPRQPGAEQELIEGIIELFPGHNYEQALHDLAGFERIWVISWFHRNPNWRPKVLPPRSGRTRRGVFATRSPHRPNPLGLSLCRLLGIDGRRVRVENPDLLDGTPILDIKPYIPYAEAFPAAHAGWLDEITPEESKAQFTVKILSTAQRQADWLLERYGIHLLERPLLTLVRDPFPHASRRIKAHPNGGFVMGVKSWRLRYDVSGHRVTIRRIESGYPAEVLSRAQQGAGTLHHEEAHREFHRKFGGSK